MSRLWTLLLLTSAPTLALAEVHTGPAHLTDADLKVVMYQAINVGLLFIGLFFLLRKKVTEFFQSRGVTFEKAVQIAQAARQEAERHNVEIKTRLKRLEDTAVSSIAKARADADVLKNKTKEEAKKTSHRLLNESSEMVAVETDKAAAMLKREFVDLSVKNARAFMGTAVNEAEQKRLNQEFIEKIQVQQ